jgi:hypothetical protein
MTAVTTTDHISHFSKKGWRAIMTQNESLYEPPALTEIGKFTELTLGIPRPYRPKDFLNLWAPL